MEICLSGCSLSSTLRSILRPCSIYIDIITLTLQAPDPTCHLGRRTGGVVINTLLITLNSASKYDHDERTPSCTESSDTTKDTTHVPVSSLAGCLGAYSGYCVHALPPTCQVKQPHQRRLRGITSRGISSGKACILLKVWSI